LAGLFVLDEQVERVAVVDDLVVAARAGDRPRLEAVSPTPAVGLPVASRGGHASVHALRVPESALNRYRVRPLALTRIDPRLLFATPTVAAAPLEVFGVAAVAAPPPPQAATVRAARGIAAALARKVMVCCELCRSFGLGDGQSQPPAGIESRDA
jgi:hypothetical protein